MGDEQDSARLTSGASRQTLVVGVVLVVVSGFMALVFMLASVLVANPCGAFGDSCDDYGTTSTELIVMLALTCLSFGGVIVGVVLVASSLRRRR